MSDFKAKMHQIRFALGLRSRPRWESLQCSPDPLAGFKGPLRGREGNRKVWRKGRERDGEGGRGVDSGEDGRKRKGKDGVGKGER